MMGPFLLQPPSKISRRIRVWLALDERGTPTNTPVEIDDGSISPPEGRETTIKSWSSMRRPACPPTSPPMRSAFWALDCPAFASGSSSPHQSGLRFGGGTRIGQTLQSTANADILRFLDQLKAPFIWRVIGRTNHPRWPVAHTISSCGGVSVRLLHGTVEHS